jgi:oxygen-independent coproporphyrinogen-3 oxidase
LPQGYVQNASAVPVYRKALLEGRLPVARGVALSREDRLRRHVIERLMCDLAVDLETACKRFGETPSLLEGSLKGLATLEQMGAISVEGHQVSIAPDWRAAARLACAAFDSYLDTDSVRHSTSI